MNSLRDLRSLLRPVSRTGLAVVQSPSGHVTFRTIKRMSMKHQLVNLLIAATVAWCISAEAQVGEHQEPATQKGNLTKFDRKVIDQHAQRYGMSCIPSAVEMVLKLLGREPESYYELQDAWKEKSDGNFSNFDNKTLRGVTFHQQFNLPRNEQFPLTQLFQRIDSELKAGRFVIVSLQSGNGWHMFVIYDEDAEGDFMAVSKNGKDTSEANHLKNTIKRMKGTDIMTYEIKDGAS